MKPRFNKSTSIKVVNRIKKKVRVRKKVKGNGERPRLSVYRSAKHIYAQVIDDVTGNTLVAVSSLKGVDQTQSGVEVAKAVGALVAKAASKMNINDVVFDRNGYIYHGRVKALADAAREAGLRF